MMDFYYMDLSPPCRAVWLTLSALDLSPNMKVVDLFKEEHNKPDFVAINPQHCVPTLVDGKLTIWERYVCLDSNTNAILNTPNCSTAQEVSSDCSISSRSNMVKRIFNFYLSKTCVSQVPDWNVYGVTIVLQW